MKSKKEICTAYHEAGHAVMRCRLNLKFSYVTIIQKEDSLGHVMGKKFEKWFNPDLANPDDLKVWDRVEKEIKSSLAGPIAEKVFRGRYNNLGSRADREWSLKVASYVAGDDKVLIAYIRYLWVSTEETLKNRKIWNAIEKLVEELLLKKKVKYDEVKRILFDLNLTK